jgi:hypothetical protein
LLRNSKCRQQICLYLCAENELQSCCSSRLTICIILSLRTMDAAPRVVYSMNQNQSLSIPKRIRFHFFRNRKLLGKLARCGWETVRDFLQAAVGRDDAVPGPSSSAYDFYEVYDSEDAWKAHKETTHHKEWRETVADWMAKPREDAGYDVVKPTETEMW